MKTKYKGIGKHNVEELEQIIDDFSEEIVDLEFEFNKIKPMYDKLSELVRELYRAGSDKKLNSKERRVATRIQQYIGEFALENNFSL